MATPTQPHASELKAEITPLELFFDLVFAFAVSQLSNHLLTHLSWRGAVETLVMLLAVFTVWYYTSFTAIIIRADQSGTRSMLLAVTLLGLFMNASLTRAFTTSGWSFVIPLLLIQFGRSFWTFVNSPNRMYRDHFFRVLLWLSATCPLWIIGAAVNSEARLLWWALAATIDLIGTWLAHPTPGRRLHSEHVEFDADHMLERGRQFLLIALGETVMTSGAAIAEAPLTAMTLATGAIALAEILALWALTFKRTDRLVVQYAKETIDPIRASRYAMNTILVMVAGLIALAVANEQVITHPYDHASIALRLLQFGGPILFLLAQGWYLWAIPQISPRLRLIGCAVLVLIGSCTSGAPFYIGLCLVGAILITLATLERR